MTNRDIYKLFKTKYPNLDVEDYRPAPGTLLTDHKEGITVFLTNGDIMVYYPSSMQRYKKKEDGMKDNTIKVNVETEGIEEATSQLEDLKDAIATSPRLVIRNPRDCTITVNETETKQEIEKENPNKMIEGIRAFSKMCNEIDSCSGCSFKDFCEKAGSRFVPYEWNL